MDRGIDGSKLALAGVAALAAVAVLRSRKGGRNTSDAESPPDEILGGMRAAQVEKDVEGGYRSRILRLTGATWSSPFGSDGVAEWGDVKLLMEAKYDVDMKSRVDVCTVLGQLLLYVKRFEQAGVVLPNVLMMADKNECCVIPIGSVKPFLDLPIDWSVAPSKGSPELTRALMSGLNVLPFIFDLDDRFDMRQVISKIESTASGEQGNVRATEANLGTIFGYWRERVFKDVKGKQGLSPTEQVDVFLKCLFSPGDVYPHPSPTKKGVLVVPGYGDRVLVNMDHYRSFFDHFEQGYKPTEIRRFLAMKDQLVEDDARRRQGAFFTPPIWAAEGNKELERVLGPNWRQECVVWDPAAGTGNLTRDHHDWGQLYSSTLEKVDAEAMTAQGWGGTAFQYDFLNPGSEGLFDQDTVNVIPPRVDRGLREAARAGKRLVFFMNPPYAEDGVAGATGETRAGVAAESLVAEQCRKKGLGRASRQLYAQFMFQAKALAEQYGFRDYTVALFSVPTFTSSGSYKEFRDWWFSTFAYKGGFLFQASHFADVSGRWGVSFTVWSSGGRTDSTRSLPIRLADLQDFSVVTTALKALYNADGREASEWVEKTQKGAAGDTPKFSSGLKIAPTWNGGSLPGSLGVLCSMSNSLMDSGTGTMFLSGRPTHKGRRHFDLLPSNWRRAVALYSARKLVGEDWINQKDEYLAPDESKPGYDQWVNDCHVFTVFDGANNCTAMRNVRYKDKLWRIKNHWFWRTREACMDALDGMATPTVFRDCEREPTSRAAGRDTLWEATGDAYFAHLLSSRALGLSPDARQVLVMLDALWLRSLPMREDYYASRPVSEKEPDLHLCAWDAGVYQLKNLWRDLYPDQWEELRVAHKGLARRLQDGVYTYGFLRR
jgi:hypothetical protein